MVGRVVYTSLLCLPTSHGGYTSPYYAHPLPPWVYTSLLLCWVHEQQRGAAACMREEETLGSVP